MSGYCLPWAGVDWATPTTPRSKTHQDIYWSRDQGLAEKRHVFIEGNALPERFTSMQTGHFTIGEIGFGFGLNFLLATRAWRESATPPAMLNYVAIERAPISPDDLARGLRALVPGDAAADTLIERYPLPSPGWHLVTLDRNVNLVLGLGDAGFLAGDLDADVDAWFLDGFSPRVNEDAWSPAIFAEMARRSRPGATLSSYSVAGAVRSGLADAGFEISRTPGFGTKAEMLRARYPGDWTPARYPAQHVAVVGSGIAGLATSRALNLRGIDVTLFDYAEVPLAGASGAPALAVYPQLSVTPEVPALFSLAAFEYARSNYGHFETTGRAHLAQDATAVGRFRQISDLLPNDFTEWLDAHDVSARIGIECRHPALWLHDAGSTALKDEYEADLSRTDFRGGKRVADAEGSRIKIGGTWQDFDTVVIATGHEELAGTGALERVPVRGQSVTGRMDPRLRAIIGGPVSAIPLSDGRVVVGSTYRQHDTSAEIRAEESLGLVAALEKCLDASFEPDSSWAGIRSSTRDRQPVAGPLPDWDLLDSWCRDESADIFTGWDQGLFALTGLGSHGATSAPILAEHIARQITGEAGCLGLSGSGRFNPARFRVRDAGRRRDVGTLSLRRQLAR